jgi:glycine cleavage system regulatory protein
MVFLDLTDAVKGGSWSISRLAFWGGAYGTVTGVSGSMMELLLFLSC